MKKYNIGISLVLLAVSVAMFVTASGLPASNDASIGPGSWPKVLACLMGFLSILLLIQSLGDKSGREAPFKPGAELKRVCIGIAILAVFCALLYFVGFMIASAFMVPAVMLLMGEKRLPVLAGLTVGVLAAVYIIFSVALKLPLPQGILF